MKKLGLYSIFAAVTLSLSTFAADDIQHLKAGDPIPNVSLKTEDAMPFDLRGAVKETPAVLIFYRGGWCPFCARHLSALVEIEDDLREAGVQLFAISPDQPAKLKETPNREKLSYRLLSDSDMSAAKAFGISFQVGDELVSTYKNRYNIDLEAASGKTHHLLPHPAVFVVDTEGVIRYAHVNPDYKVRLEPAKILEAAKRQ